MRVFFCRKWKEKYFPRVVSRLKRENIEAVVLPNSRTCGGVAGGEALRHINYNVNWCHQRAPFI